jgi:hypothetical protein
MSSWTVTSSFAASRGTTLPWYESAKVPLLDFGSEPFGFKRDKNMRVNRPDSFIRVGVKRYSPYPMLMYRYGQGV